MSAPDARILVVDDELGMREGCRRILEAEGYEVTTAGDGLSGLDAFQKQGPFSAVIADLKMPRMSGLELVEKVRRLDDDVVLFIITAYATIDTAVDATKRGAYSYIPKPFTPDELLVPVKHGLDRRLLTMESRRLREERMKRMLEVTLERSNSRTILSCMTDAVLVVNQDEQIVLRNAAAGRVLPEMEGRSIPAPLSALKCPPLEELLLAALQSGIGPGIVSKEITLGECSYLINVSPVAEPGGEIRGAVAVLRDVSAMKKLENAKSMFVSMVAHELKTPLAAIEGYLNLILSSGPGGDPADTESMMRKALTRASTVRTLVSDLLNLRAIEVAGLDLNRISLSLWDVVNQAATTARERAEAKGIELGLEADPGASEETILADRDALIMVFSNLIDNAIKYTPEGGHVWVRVEQDRVQARVTVRDDGIGMSGEELPRIFEEFYRAKNKRSEDVQGTGLGLTLVKRVVDMHHGRVTVLSEPGKGSTFTVSLPISGHEG